MLMEPVALLPDVPEVLADVGRDHRLVLITKGDLVHQTRKVTTSGLAHHFELVEVVKEKDPETYARSSRLEVKPARFCMVGNTVRSDILPVLAIGGHAVHVPYPLTWELEHVEHDEDVAELESIAELPGRAARSTPRRQSLRRRTSVTRWSALVQDQRGPLARRLDVLLAGCGR